MWDYKLAWLVNILILKQLPGLKTKIHEPARVQLPFLRFLGFCKDENSFLPMVFLRKYVS